MLKKFGLSIILAGAIAVLGVAAPSGAAETTPDLQALSSSSASAPLVGNWPDRATGVAPLVGNWPDRATGVAPLVGNWPHRATDVVPR